MKKTLREGMLIKACNVVPPDAKNFQSSTHFHNVLKGLPSLQRAMLSSVTPTCPNFSNDADIIKYLDEERVSLKSKYSNEAVSKIFFETFKYSDFKWTSNISPDNLNPQCKVMLHPTADLFTCDTAFFESFRSEIDSLQKDMTKNGKLNIMRIRHDMKNLDILYNKMSEHPVIFITKIFKFAWDLQADGENTNATLTSQSIIKLSRFLLSSKALKNGDAILDCGSSYGSLPLQLINAINVEDNNISVRGFGMEYANIRHILGSFCFHKMISLLRSMSYMPLRSFDCRLINRNLLHITQVSAGINLMLSFDKVFDPELLIHLLLVALNSPGVKYFLTCRDSFHSQRHGIHIKGTRHCFRYGDLMKYLGFSYIGTSQALKMNGGENGGKFSLYSVPHKVVDSEFLQSLQDSFISKLEVCENFELSNLRVWEKAQSNETTEDDELFPMKSNPSIKLDSPFVKKTEEYYRREGNLDKLKTKGKEKKAKTEILSTCICMKDFICQDYATKNCVICTSRFRSEEASRILCYVKEVAQKGKGLFAKNKILKGTYICQYRGKKVPKGTVGNYVAQVDESTLIDAEKTNFLGRYANHSCEPNCSIRKVYQECTAIETRKTKKRKKIESKTLLWILAEKDIFEGSEITFNYGKDFKRFFKNGICLCNSCLI